MSTNTAPSTTLQAQRDLVARLEESGWDLIVGDAFVRGMRDIGYKSTSYALAELIDNSIQASATRVDVVFGYDGGLKPSKLAVIDNGVGMEPKMVRASLIWGAGTRLQDRSGFGKYGYGLPSASVSQCMRVTVYSKTADSAWHSTYLDIDEISRGEWTQKHRISTPVEQPDTPPQWVIDQATELDAWPVEHGTIVVWDRLDPHRVDYKRREELRNALVTNLGVIYRNYLTETPMTVDGVAVEPCDPLFLTEGFRYYALDEDRAIAPESSVIEVKDKATQEIVGRLHIRFSRFPATFFRRPEAKDNNKPSAKQMNERLDIADAHNGIIFLRNGRQIDVVRPPRGTYSFNATTDRYWNVEVDFDATLDDEFSMTTAKQQVKPSERIWDMLKDSAKIFEVIAQMRREYQKEADTIKTRAEARKRASVEAIENAKKFRTSKQPKETPARKQEAEDHFREEARRRSERSGVPEPVVRRELEAQQEGNPLRVDLEDLPGAPFFRCEQQGGQRVLLINKAHAFHSDLYAGPGSSARMRAALEILLWALGEAEVDAEPDSDRRRFYERDRSSQWSPYVEDALRSLRTIEVVTAADDTQADAA